MVCDNTFTYMNWWLCHATTMETVDTTDEVGFIGCVTDVKHSDESDQAVVSNSILSSY